MEFVQQNIVWVTLAAVSGFMLLLSFLRDGGPSVTPSQATLLLNREDAVVVDVRESQEWSAGHIPQSRHIALGQFDQRIDELEKFKSRPIVVVCQSGNRSAQACQKLRQAGFAKVYNLSGGVRAWADASLPLTTK